MDKGIERALYRRNVDYDAVDEFKDRNIFNRDFRSFKKTWVPNNPTKKGHNSTISPILDHMSPAIIEKKKREAKLVWKLVY